MKTDSPINKVVNALAEKDLESKLADIKIQQIRQRHILDNAKHRREIEALSEECLELNKRVWILSASVIIAFVVIVLLTIFV